MISYLPIIGKNYIWNSRCSGQTNRYELCQHNWNMTLLRRSHFAMKASAVVKLSPFIVLFYFDSSVLLNWFSPCDALWCAQYVGGRLEGWLHQSLNIYKCFCTYLLCLIHPIMTAEANTNNICLRWFNIFLSTPTLYYNITGHQAFV